MGFLLKTEIIINASPEKIWSILTDFEKYPSWNPFITSIQGDDIGIGKRLQVRIEPPETNANNFEPYITAFEINEKFSWQGVLLIKGIFDGEHQFILINNGNGTTTFVQNENFSGILVPIFKKLLNNNTRRGFEAMNRKLKKIAEQNDI